jgi:DNA-binding NarL/FixJ family response regulator
VSAALRLLVVDPHVPFTDALLCVLGAEPDIAVTVARDGAVALAAAAHEPPSVAMIELDLPDIDGLATIRALRALCPHTAVIALTASVGPRRDVEAADAGASALVARTSRPSDLVRAIRSAANGTASTPDAERSGHAA